MIIHWGVCAGIELTNLRPAYKNKKISDYDYKELPALKIPDKLSNFPHVITEPDSTRIPLLEEVFITCHGIPIQIDVKNGSEKLVLLVGNMIYKYSRPNLILW